jgi:glutamate synthase (NADPH/NADH) large chain
MSGGVAYIYRLRADRVNRDALESGDVSISNLDNEDRTRLRELLSKHVQETQSSLAERILADFETQAGNFSRVLPSDYAAVLKIRKDALSQNLDPDGDVVWQQILEVTRG